MKSWILESVLCSYQLGYESHDSSPSLDNSNSQPLDFDINEVKINKHKFLIFLETTYNNQEKHDSFTCVDHILFVVFIFFEYRYSLIRETIKVIMEYENGFGSASGFSVLTRD